MEENKKSQNGFLKFIRKHIRLTVFIIVVLVVVIVFSTRSRNTPSDMMEETVERRDIETYNSFVGNVESASDRSLIPQVTAEAVEVLVDEGDTVTQGEVLVQLDSSEVEYNIAMQEATLDFTNTTNNYNVRDAEEAYENYNEALSEGLDVSVVTAKTQMDTAKDTYDSAISAYNQAAAHMDDGTYDGIASYFSAKSESEKALISAEQALSDGNAAVENAENSLAQAQQALDDYDVNQSILEAQAEQQAAEQAAAQAAAGLTSETDTTGLTSSSLSSVDTTRQGLVEAVSAAESNLASAQAQIPSLQTAVNQADTSYYNAQVQFESKKQSSLETLQEQIDTAKIAYDDACESYDAAVLAAEQQLETYQTNVDATEASTDTTSSELEIQNLVDSLDDYTITAPCDGTVTTMDLSEGDMTTAGMEIGTISNLNTLTVDIKVDEYSIANTRAGSDVTIYIDSIDASYDGTMTWIADTATIENGVSYYEAKVSFTTDEHVKSGMSVEVRLTNADEKDVVSVSVDAINYREDNTAYVLLEDEDGNEKEQDVTLGASDGYYIQITDGLSEGDTVLIDESSSFLEDRMGQMSGTVQGTMSDVMSEDSGE